MIIVSSLMRKKNLKLVSKTLLTAYITFAAMSCKTSQPGLTSLSNAESVNFICEGDVTYRNEAMEAIDYSKPGEEIEILEGTLDHNSHTYQRIKIVSNGAIVWIANQFISDKKCESSGSTANLPIVYGKAICEYSWTDKVGTTDYRVYDNYRRRNYHAPDRAEGSTLVGSGVQLRKTLCQKARFLKPCYDKAAANPQNKLSKDFINWAKNKGYNPERILLAISEQETKLGGLKDQGSNGVGIAQIVTALLTNSKQVPDSDHATWAGITHNILTNLEYAMRAAGAKANLLSSTGESASIYNLAKYYNGHPSHKHAYADNVSRYYNQLKACGI